MNRVALITGTRKGIGRELAEHFLAQGYTVVGCSRKDAGLDHDNYTHYQCDVTDDKGVASMVRNVKKQHGRIDVLVNNAGLASMNHLLLTPKSTGEKLFSVNTLGAFVCMRECAKIMSRQKYGRIVNFTTVAVPLNLEGEAMYAASKAALESLTKVAARELGEMGITVNAIGPTPIDTDLIKHVPKDKIDALIDRQAVKRLGSFEDVKNVVDFFVSEASSFVTGQIVYLGGING